MGKAFLFGGKNREFPIENLRIYGNPPYSVAVLHGGPGVSGDMAPVAQELSLERGVLEPLQTKPSVDGQVEELKIVLEEKGKLPAILVGYSWGAKLGFLLAARHPELVRKLILVSSGPFEEKYVKQMKETQTKRLTREEQEEVRLLRQKLHDLKALTRFGEIMSQVDSYDPLPLHTEGVVIRPDIYEGVWGEAKELRKSGKLLEEGKKIQCPVVAIHGDHDPHPVEGVQKPLTAILKDFRFTFLERCGHTPWMEKQARDEFYRVLKIELS